MVKTHRQLSGWLFHLYIVHRKKIAAFLSIDDVKKLAIPVLGDLRRLRKSIDHHNGIALPEVEKCEVYKWFNKDDAIDFTHEQMIELKRYFFRDFENDCFLCQEKLHEIENL